MAVCLKMEVMILISRSRRELWWIHGHSRCVTFGYQGDIVYEAYSSEAKWIKNIEYLPAKMKA